LRTTPRCHTCWASTQLLSYTINLVYTTSSCYAVQDPNPQNGATCSRQIFHLNLIK
ncbi:hypothetical protein STEG23_030088, partial [Scotinomys teguina]